MKLRAFLYNIQTREKDTPASTEAYLQILEKVREHIGKHHSAELISVLSDEKAGDSIRLLISKLADEKGYRLDGYDLPQLVNRLYADMAGFGFLDEYIHDPSLEEINVNSWRDIEIVTEHGVQKLKRHFDTPQQAADIVRKMARLGGFVLDGTTPLVESYLTRGVRISASIPPCVDERHGAQFSLRRQRPIMLDTAAYERTDTATNEELDTLIAFANYGVSICFAGGTSSGKTTDMAFLLSNIQSNKRIVTIEETPELVGLERTDGKGNIENRLIQFLTREHPSEELNIDMNDLLRFSLRQNPDVLVPSEMRGKEALAAQEAAHTGHTVITSLHSNSARETHGRILTMCRMSGTLLSDDLLSRLIAEAFPIIVFKKQMADNSRKILEIVEMAWDSGKVQYITLFKYMVRENVTDECGRTVRVTGKHEKSGRVSEKLIHRMLENGAPDKLIHKIGGAPD